MSYTPLRLAVVDKLAASDPEPGSVKQYDAILSMLTNSGNNLSLCSLLPNCEIIQVHML